MNNGIGNIDLENDTNATHWQASTVYQAGDLVIFEHNLYEAKWWTLNNEPGAPNGPWEALDD